MNQGVKTNLAKLLATENLVVEHANVETASFDVVNRVLTLPIWDTSEDVYDLLVGHEVGHALFTPADVIDKSLPSSYVNVVEDARIERMIKSTYPGLLKSFSAGYKELGDKDFFDIEDKNLNDFNLIDRINLYFKLGIHNVSTVIPFKKEEEKFVKLVRDTKTFDEVCEVARQIRQYMEDNKESKDAEELPDFNLDSTGSTGSNNVDITEPEDSDSNDNENQIETETQGGSESIKQSIEEWLDEAEDSMYEDDELEVLTEESFNRNQKRLLSSETWKTITPPQTDWDQYITLNDDFVDDMKVMDAVLDTKKYYSYRWQDEKDIVDCTVHQKWKKDLNEFKTNSKKEVNYLVKEFECRKAAASYARASTSRTGVLDTTKLHTYRYNEDLFKKVTTFADGKNHGLMMFVDWSGSMHNNLIPTMKQLLNIVQFCKKVSIPFEVYTFVENRDYETYTKGKHFSKCSDQDGMIAVSDGFKLVQIFNSKSKVKIDKQIDAAWTLVHSVTHDYIHYGDSIQNMMKYEMGGTPLNETLFAAIELFKRFKKSTRVEKVNTIFLTDGESNQLTCCKHRVDSRTDEMYVSRSTVGTDGSVVSFRDPKTGYQQHKLIDGNYGNSWSTMSINVTTKLIQYYRWVTGSNVVGYRLSVEKPSAIQKAGSYDQDTFRKQWKKNNYVIEKDLGYNEMYIIKVNKDFEGQTTEINANSSSTNSKLRNEFKKHMKSKGFHKILLSKFVDQIA